MNKYIFGAMLLTGCALALTSCDDNSWNDKLPGFEEERPTDVKTLNYTLTEADYKTLAANSTNKALAGDENAKALSQVGTNGYFTSVITPEKYIPALLQDPKFRYFALSDGSAIKVTYKVADGYPEELTALKGAEKYTVTEADYQKVWDSETDFTEAFAPSKPAARNIPAILKTARPDATEGDVVIVNYNNASSDPVFNSTETPFTPTQVLGSISKGDDVEVKGVVMATSTQGPIVTDGSGSVFVYAPTNNSDLKIGDRISVASTVDTYNYGFQIKKGADVEVLGSQSVTYPAPRTWTGAEIDRFVADAMAQGAAPIVPVYSRFTGKAIVGKFVNVEVDGATVQLSPYGLSDDLKAEFVDGQTVTFEGYAMAVASKGKYLNVVITRTVADSRAAASRAGVKVASENMNAVYRFDGEAWTTAPSTTILSHADYQSMNQSYDNFSGDIPETYFPTFLKLKYPYAAPDEAVFLVYYYYNGTETQTRADQYTYNGTEWTLNNYGVTTSSLQFVRSNGKWNYDPSTTITLPSGKGQALSTLYYQTCVDWVKNNVPDGNLYVSSYGNNEYYCGTSAYQGNVDLRAGSARAQYEAGYASMTDEEVVATMKNRFETEVMPAALAAIHPDAAPVDGIEVLYTINFYYYDGKTKTATVIYEVTAPGTFTFKSSTWGE